VAGDAPFNEALATTVEEEGVRRWLRSSGRESDLAVHAARQGRYLQVIGLLRRTRAELHALYATGLDAEAMRAAKRQTFANLRDSYARLRATWDGPAPFESWFKGEVNNAHLAAVATYYDCVPGFERELAAVGGDLTVFYRRVRVLAKLEQSARDAALCSSP
jgi:predicted aminopeptidase